MLYLLTDPAIAQQVMVAGEGAKTVNNRDLQLTVLLSPSKGIEADWIGSPGGNFSILDPLGSIPFDGSTDLYALPVGGQVLLDVVAGSTGWAPSPIQIAAQIAPLSTAIAQEIAATGIPIIPSPTIIYNL